MVILQRWVSLVEGEVITLMEGKWSCYRGGKFRGGEWSCYDGGQFNGGRMVMLQRWPV